MNLIFTCIISNINAVFDNEKKTTSVIAEPLVMT